MGRNAKEFKELFYESCRAKGISTANKSLFFWQVTDQMERKEEEPLLEEVAELSAMELLFCALSDNSLLFSRFEDGIKLKEEERRYQELLVSYNQLWQTYQLHQKLKIKWEQVLRKNVTVIESGQELPGKNTEEINELCARFRKAFLISEKDSPELFNNLSIYVEMTKKHPIYREIAPLFFFCLMTKHTKRLAENENFTAIPQKIWVRKEYKIYNDNYKNFTKYQEQLKLFRKLMKFYKEREELDTSLCKFGFLQCSNLSEWAWQQGKKHLKSYFPPFHYELLNRDTSYFEICESAEYDPYQIYKVSTRMEERYLECEDQIYLEELIGNYLYENEEYLIHTMNYIYNDAPAMCSMVNEIFDNCMAKVTYDKEIPKNCILLSIYRMLCEYVDRAVWAKVWGVW